MPSDEVWLIPGAFNPLPYVSEDIYTMPPPADAYAEYIAGFATCTKSGTGWVPSYEPFGTSVPSNPGALVADLSTSGYAAYNNQFVFGLKYEYSGFWINKSRKTATTGTPAGSIVAGNHGGFTGVAGVWAFRATYSAPYYSPTDANLANLYLRFCGQDAPPAANSAALFFGAPGNAGLAFGTPGLEGHLLQGLGGALYTISVSGLPGFIAHTPATANFSTNVQFQMDGTGISGQNVNFKYTGALLVAGTYPLTISLTPTSETQREVSAATFTTSCSLIVTDTCAASDPDPDPHPEPCPKPAPPANVWATPDNVTRLTRVHWDAVPGASAYLVRRDGLVAKRTTKLQWQDEFAAASGTGGPPPADTHDEETPPHLYSVAAVNDCGEGPEVFTAGAERS